MCLMQRIVIKLELEQICPYALYWREKKRKRKIEMSEIRSVYTPLSHQLTLEIVSKEETFIKTFVKAY